MYVGVVNVGASQNLVALKNRGEKTNRLNATESRGVTSKLGNSLNLVDTNHNRILVKNNPISFKGGLPVKFAAPLEMKIASVLQDFRKGDVCVVADKASKAKKAIKESIGSMDEVIKRVFMIEEDGFEGAISISKAGKNSNLLTNLDEKNVFYSNSKDGHFLRKNEKVLITPREVVNVGGKTFSVKRDFENNLKTIKDMEVKTFDFSKESDNYIKMVNNKVIGRLVLPGENTSSGKKILFKHVGGQAKAKEEMKKSIIFPIKYPNAFGGVKMNKGTILTGGPGTGKTLLAEATGNEADAHFIKLNGLELESKWVGETEEQWRDLFSEAIEKQPTVIFIDEFDAVAGKRGAANGSKYDDKVVNQLLTLMSDLEKNQDDVHVLVATNRLDILDEAVTRSGRFGKHIPMEKPDLNGCKEILDIHLDKKPVSVKLDRGKIAKELFDVKASGADIDFIANESHANAYERLGIYKKMEDGTFKDSDLQKLKIEPEDFDKSLNNFKKQKKLKKNNDRNRVGFPIGSNTSNSKNIKMQEKQTKEK